MSEVEISVLIPVYNNGETLDELLDRLTAVLDPLEQSYEIVLVDDGSRDRSWQILEERSEADPRIRPFAMVRNYGSQAASCAAADQARGRIIVHIDADLENYPEDIPSVLDHLDRGYDFVAGYRENRGGPFLTRRLPSRLLNAYVRRQTGTDIIDVGCGLRALEASLAHDLESEGEARRLLTPVLLRRARRIAQVPVRHRPKTTRGGHSFLTLLGIALDYYMLTSHRPFLVSAVASVVTVGIGALTLIFGDTAIAISVIGFGMMGGVLSLIGEYAQRLYQLSQGTPFYKLKEKSVTAKPAMQQNEG